MAPLLSLQPPRITSRLFNRRLSAVEGTEVKEQLLQIHLFEALLQVVQKFLLVGLSEGEPVQGQDLNEPLVQALIPAQRV